LVQAARVYKKKFNKKYILKKYPLYIKANTAAGIDKLQMKNFDKIKEGQIDLILNKVNNNNYKFTNYKEKLILKNRNSLPRLISIPTLRDRIVLKIIHEILMETFQIELKLVQTVISDFTLKCSLYDSYIKIDISNFFGSLNHDFLIQRLGTKIRKKELRDVIVSAIKNPTVNSYHRRNISVEENKTGVPQGIPIANVLAEIYFKELDSKYNARTDIAYFRYVDDILILCNSTDIDDLKNETINEITNIYLLSVNEDKCKDGALSDGMTYLGYKFVQTPSGMLCTVKDESIAKMENSLVALFSKFKNSVGKMKSAELIFYLNLKITGAIVKELDDSDKSKNEIDSEEKDREKKYGWLFFYSQINDLRVLYHLDYFVESLIARYDSKGVIDKGKIKKFSKAYYEIIQRRKKSKYLFKPSELSIEEKRLLLLNTFDIKLKDLKSDENIEYHFNKKVRRKILELEADIQEIS